MIRLTSAPFRASSRTRTRPTRSRMGGSAQRRLPGAWAGTGSNGGTTAYLWVGDSPAEVSDRCGGCCLFCLSVCLLSLSRGGWCVVGLPSCLWPAICEPLVSLRPFCLGLPLGVSCLGFSPWRCESGPRTCEVPIDDEAVRFLCCSEVLRPEVPLGLWVKVPLIRVPPW